MFAAKIKYSHKKFKEDLGTHVCIIYDCDDFFDVVDILQSNDFEGIIEIVNIKKSDKKRINSDKWSNFTICIK